MKALFTKELKKLYLTSCGIKTPEQLLKVVEKAPGLHCIDVSENPCLIKSD